ncbi:MAG: hypothetical protein ACM3SR_11425 [Ignavibacteriales bacterium]
MGVIVNKAEDQGTGTEILNPSEEEKNPDDVRYDDPLDADLSGSDDIKITNESVRLISLKRALDLDALDVSHDREIKEILEWAKESGIKNKSMLLARIREIDYMLGNPDDKPKIDKIYQYIKIRGQIRNLSNKLEGLRR